MNPINWKREHQIALVLALIIGAVIGLVTGYIAYASSSGASGGVSFSYWVDNPIRYAGLWWGLGGAGVGAAVLYIKRLTSN